MWEIVYYTTSNGSVPVREFIGTLSGKEAAKVDYYIIKLKKAGFKVGPPHIKKIKGKIWELRVKGHNQYRILFFAVAGKKIVLLHGFTKKRQRTLLTDINISLRRMKIFLGSEQK